MIPSTPSSTAAQWARFRFSVVGSLLSSPPARGALKTAIRSLAAKTWSHPTSGRDVQFAPATVERWYYAARHGHDDPVRALRRAVRKDRGQIALATALAERLILQHRDHPDWTYQLHYDNLAALARAEPALGRLPSYATIKRYMQAHGLVKQPRFPAQQRPGQARAQQRRETREVRSYEATHVRSAVASRFPSRIAQSAHSRWPVANPDRAGNPR